MEKKHSENKIARQVFDCPSCGKKAGYQETIYNVPHFGKMLIGSLACDHCKWKTTQTFSLADQHKAVKFEAQVETVEDMETKVIRAGTGTVKIPELGVEISPTNYTEGYYNNLEGLLELAEEAIGTPQDKKGQELLDKIKQARNGKFKFTVILEDPEGNSALIGKKVKKLA